MKKQAFLIALIVYGYVATAQYGHRTYNVDTVSTEQFNDGFITDILTSGGQPIYAGAGFANMPNTAGAVTTRSRFNRIDYNGNQLSGNVYYLFNAGPEVQSRSNSVCERGTTGYLLSGTAFNSSTTGDVLLLNANTSGALTSARRVDMAGIDEAFSTRKSTNLTNRYYTVGSSITTAGSVSQAFIMKHNETGSTIDWVRKFNLQCSGVNRLAEAVAVIDDPTSGNVVVIGNINFNGLAGGCQQAFIARFTSAGVLTWLRIINSTSMANIQLQNIRATDSPQQYVITGSAIASSPAGKRQVLLMRVNTSNAAGPSTVFARLIRSNGPTPNYPVQNQIGYDVACRKDSIGNISYYIAGSTQYTTGTSTDGLLIRTNATGTPVNMYEYFGNGSEALYALDINQTIANGRGIAAFGAFDSRSTSATIRRKSWLAKTYFNLVSGCNSLLDTGIVSTPSVTYASFSPVISTTYTTNTLTYQSGSTTNQIVCWSTIIGGGSNLREMGDETTAVTSENATLKALAFPNPITGNELNLEIESEDEEIAELIILDLSGRMVQSSSIDLLTGTNRSLIDASDLRQGAYMLRITTESGKSQTIRFIRN